MKDRYSPKIILGISAGIAAYKMPDFISLLRQKNIEVYVIMTRAAHQMFDPSIFENVSGHKVYDQLISAPFDYQKVISQKQVDHIELANIADCLVIAPATANIIGKIALGLADDLLTTTVLATKAPVLICPSMNTNMWTNPLVQENIGRLKKIGVHILEPSYGRLACGASGIGRLVDKEIILTKIISILERGQKLRGKRIMITAGGTQEPIDRVRLITNRGSGKMGLALAEKCFEMGAQVLLLRSSTGVASNYPINQEIFENWKDLEKLIKKNINAYDALFHTAAVTDFEADTKIKGKIESAGSINLTLRPVSKILHKIKDWNPKISLIGFKAVYRKREKELIEIGMSKLQESKSDYIIVNDIGKSGVGFGVDTNEVYIISDRGLVKKVKKAPKDKVAEKILDEVF